MNTYLRISLFMALFVLFSATAHAQNCLPGDPPIPVTILGADSYCSGETANLSTDPALPGGTFSPAQMGLVNNGDGTADFSAPLSGGTVTYSFDFFYTDPATGCTYAGSDDVTVFPEPTGSIGGIPVPGIDPQVCVGDAIDLTGNPPGGFFGPQAGLTDNGDGTAVFTAPLSGAVAVFDINYFFIDPVTGCDGVASGNILVFDCGDDCPTLFNTTVSSNTVCSGENVVFEATLLPLTSTDATVTVSNGVNTFNLVYNNSGLWTGSTTLVNNSCAPLVDSYTITVFCTDGSVSGFQTEDITIFPNDLSQFITTSSPDNGCTVTVSVDPSCVNANGIDYLSVVGADTQGPSAPGTTGTYSFCFDYFSASSNCVDDFCLDVPYNCMDDDCGIDAGILSGNAFVCSGEFVFATAIGSIGIDGTDCTLEYVLHDGASPATGTVYGTSSNGVFTNDGSYPMNQSLCITAVASCASDASCYDESNCLPVVFMEPITIDVSEFCDPVTGLTTVSVTFNGGGPTYLPGVHTYNVIGSYVNPTAEPGTTYTFGPLTAGMPYSIEVTDDGKGCSAIASGVADDCQTQGCTNSAGVMSPALQTACDGQFVNAPAAGVVVQPGSMLVYAIHDGQFNVGTIYQLSSTGVFTNNGSIPTNIDLYVSAVVAPVDASGQPILSDPCTDVALPGTPVRFYDPINIVSNYVCNEATGEYTVTFSITGGGPSFPNSDHFYSVSGVWSGLASPGVTYTSSPISDGNTYTISVFDDGKGCSASFTSGNVECEKLPVELISYDGEVQSDGNFLKWVTGTEINNDYFTLERSVGDVLNFEFLTTVNGAGNTTINQSYDYLDRNAPSGDSYYRLSQTDFDGTHVIVGVVLLTRGEYTFGITQVAPNPTSSLLNIYVSSSIQTVVEISVIDALGRMLMSQNTDLDFDVTTHSIDVSDLPTGVYFIQISNGDLVEHSKFVKE